LTRPTPSNRSVNKGVGFCAARERRYAVEGAIGVRSFNSGPTVSTGWTYHALSRSFACPGCRGLERSFLRRLPCEGAASEVAATWLIGQLSMRRCPPRLSFSDAFDHGGQSACKTPLSGRTTPGRPRDRAPVWSMARFRDIAVALRPPRRTPHLPLHPIPWAEITASDAKNGERNFQPRSTPFRPRPGTNEGGSPSSSPRSPSPPITSAPWCASRRSFVTAAISSARTRSSDGPAPCPPPIPRRPVWPAIRPACAAIECARDRALPRGGAASTPRRGNACYGNNAFRRRCAGLSSAHSTGSARRVPDPGDPDTAYNTGSAIREDGKDERRSEGRVRAGRLEPADPRYEPARRARRC
jgi:hypothetical protein